jgi:predicted  nucleic acid-binding Zn-ribbon protein
MFPIRLDDKLLFQCLNCGKRFWEDGEKKVGEVKCPHCGSNNHDIVTQNTNPK